jgi:hypothetical protein
VTELSGVLRDLLGVTGLDQPFVWPIVETVVWSCTASSILLADLAIQWHELATMRRRTVRTQPVAAALAPAE